MTKRPTPQQRQAQKEYEISMALFVAMMLILLMCASCTAPKGSALPCYYFADKGGAQK
jgi:hypothetical protein